MFLFSLGKWSHLLPRKDMPRTSKDPPGGQTHKLESQHCSIWLCDLTQVACHLWALVAPSLQGKGSLCYLRVLSALIEHLMSPSGHVVSVAVRRWPPWGGHRSGPRAGRRQPRNHQDWQCCLVWVPQASHQAQEQAVQWLQLPPACCPGPGFMVPDQVPLGLISWAASWGPGSSIPTRS